MNPQIIPIEKVSPYLSRGSKLYLLLILSIGIMIGNVIAMLIVNRLNPVSLTATALLDSTLLLLQVFPILYFLVFRPLSKQITERKTAEKELRNAISLLDAIIESIHNGILVVNLRGEVLKSNARFAKMWNTPAPIINSKDGKIIRDYILAQVVDSDGFTRRISELSRDVEVEGIDQIDLKDGRIFKRISKPLYHGGKPKGRVWSFLDITDRKKAENALLKSEALYRNLVEKLPDGVYKSTHDGKFIEVNQAMVEMLGYSTKEELLAIDIKEQLYFVLSDRDSLELENTMREVGVFRLKKKDKSEIWVEDHGWYNQDENGNILYHSGIIRDFTSRRRAEEEIKRKNEELLKVNAEKDKFFSIIAHDLRGPFSGFLGLTQIMAEELPDLTMEEIQQIAVNMNNSATNLFSLLENLLEWSKMQQGLIPFKPQILNLAPVIDNCLTIMVEYSQRKGIQITHNIPDSMEVYADTNILQSIIRNLVTNAIKFTNSGGKVTISAQHTEYKEIEIVIADTGIGMSKTMVDQLFRFEAQINREGTAGEPSSGLGLLLCKEFVEKHGGKIRVESHEREGSTFLFTIPETAQ